MKIGTEEYWNKAQKLMTDKDFNQELENAHQAGRDYIKSDKSKDFMPTVIVVDTNGERHVCRISQGLGENSEEKNDNMRALGAMIAGENITVVSIYLTTEAWQTKHAKNITREDIEVGNVPVPSEDPNREEVFITTGFSYDRSRTGLIEDSITHNKQGEMKLKPKMFAPYVKLADTFDVPLLESFYDGYTMALNPIEAMVNSLVESIKKTAAMGDPKAQALVDKGDEELKAKVRMISQKQWDKNMNEHVNSKRHRQGKCGEDDK